MALPTLSIERTSARGGVSLCVGEVDSDLATLKVHVVGGVAERNGE
jgi:hypothetical protein